MFKTLNEPWTVKKQERKKIVWCWRIAAQRYDNGEQLSESSPETRTTTKMYAIRDNTNINKTRITHPG